jgi:hypothetical protein
MHDFQLEMIMGPISPTSFAIKISCFALRLLFVNIRVIITLHLHIISPYIYILSKE